MALFETPYRGHFKHPDEAAARVCLVMGWVPGVFLITLDDGSSVEAPLPMVNFDLRFVRDPDGAGKWDDLDQLVPADSGDASG
jgi:hypothetical protein